LNASSAGLGLLGYKPAVAGLALRPPGKRRRDESQRQRNAGDDPRDVTIEVDH
jgi:hypothetical protein